MATVSILPEAQKQFNQLPVAIRARIENVFARLQRWPNVSGAKPLRGNLTGHYRMRTGDWRVQFYVTADDVSVEKVGHRDRFYEE